MACAGSQAAIQALPRLRKKSTVGLFSPAYAEHAHCWQQAGHRLVTVTPETLDKQLKSLNVLIIINPNNPTGTRFSQGQLLDWHEKLQHQGGWLIVDEAFIDADSADSLAGLPPRTGLIILRSLGKFFGLAGLRCGFVIAESRLLIDLEEKLGAWPLSHPSRYVATAALLDTAWQQQTRHDLTVQSQRLRDLLNQYHLAPTGGNALFQWIKTPQAEILFHHFAQRGILLRRFDAPASLRFGLPKHEADWQRLQQALIQCPLSADAAFIL